MENLYTTALYETYLNFISGEIRLSWQNKQKMYIYRNNELFTTGIYIYIFNGKLMQIIQTNISSISNVNAY